MRCHIVGGESSLKGWSWMCMTNASTGRRKGVAAHLSRERRSHCLLQVKVVQERRRRWLLEIILVVSPWYWSFPLCGIHFHYMGFPSNVSISHRFLQRVCFCACVGIIRVCVSSVGVPSSSPSGNKCRKVLYAGTMEFEKVFSKDFSAPRDSIR